MSTRRRASGSATSDGALLLHDYAGSEDNEDPERQHDHSELNNPEYFEFLDDNGIAESSEDGHGKTPGVKTGREKWYRIYVLHLLFMWNLRTYEFASVSLTTQRVSHNILLMIYRSSLYQLPFRIVLPQQQ